MLTSVRIGWSDGKPRAISRDDMRLWLAGAPETPAGDRRVAGAGEHSPANPPRRMPRPRSKNAPKPALTVDYSSVPRNEVDAFSLECRQVEGLSVRNAEAIQQFESLSKAAVSFSNSANTTASQLRQPCAHTHLRPPLSELVDAAPGMAAKSTGPSARPRSCATADRDGGEKSGRRPQQEQQGQQRRRRTTGGNGFACSIMVLALVVQPVVPQMAQQAADEYSVYDAHGKGALGTGLEMKPDCSRGNHRTSGDVTTSGDGSCRLPRRAHQVDKDDHLGKLIAPLFEDEFLLENTGGPWGCYPRHISRQDPRYFAAFSLFKEDQVLNLVKNSSALADQGAKRGVMLNLEDIKLVRGRRHSRRVLGEHTDADTSLRLGSTVSWVDALDSFKLGFSIYLRHVDVRSAPLARFVQGLENQLGIPMRAHLQWTPALSEGGGEHAGQLTDSTRHEDGTEHAEFAAMRRLKRGDERRELGGDVFLLQVSGRQMVHAYQMPQLDVSEAEALDAREDFAGDLAGGTEGLHDTAGRGSPPDADEGLEKAHAGRGTSASPRHSHRSVQGMVRGDELDDRLMFSSLLRPGDTLYIPRG